VGDDGVAIYVIHWNAPEWCADAVDSLRAGSASARITVVDNGGVSPLDPRLLPADVAVIRMPENRGYAGGANAGLADWRALRPRPRTVAFAAHDVSVDPGGVDRLNDALRSDPRLGIVAPRLVAPFASSGGTWDGLVASQSDQSAPGDGLRYCDWVSGTLLLVRDLCIEDVGDFDDSFHSYGEDLDYSLRAGRRGWRVAVDPSVIAAGRGTVDLATAERRIVENQWRVARKLATGFGAMARLDGRIALMILRTAMGATAPWRTKRQRADSRRYLRMRWHAVRKLRTRAPRGSTTVTYE
jgi:GT2 family glycosyltransferase